MAEISILDMIGDGLLKKHQIRSKRTENYIREWCFCHTLREVLEKAHAYT